VVNNKEDYLIIGNQNFARLRTIQWFSDITAPANEFNVGWFIVPFYIGVC